MVENKNNNELRAISPAEFFEKNRHLLGFDNPIKALLTSVKEAVDNSIDAAEGAKILPEIFVQIQKLGETRFKMIVEDDGPGISKEHAARAFGKLLYGSKFQTFGGKQSLTRDEPVIFLRNSKAEIRPIGEFVDSYLKNGEEIKDISNLGILAPAFGWQTYRYKFRPISHVIRHKRENEIIEIVAEQNRSVKVTGCHSLFTFDFETESVKVVEARQLKVGDFILAPKKLPLLGRLKENNILDSLQPVRLGAGVLGLQQQRNRSEKLLQSDLCLLKIKQINTLNSGFDYVYDLSVPECENFVGGFGGIACHNSRGQQGIGISAAVLYGQLTSGKPARIITKTKNQKQALVLELKIDIKTNEPQIITETTIDWKKEHGTRIEIELEAKYMEKKASVVEYVRQTAVVNPHAKITYIDPEGQKTIFDRVVDKLPKEPEFIKPHPYGVELGVLLRMLKETSARALKSFLTTEFDKVGPTTADEILKTTGLDPKIMPKLLSVEQADKLIKAMHGAKIMSPTTTCLSPIGAENLKKALEAEYNTEFAYAVTRPPSVYRGNPFLIEVAAAISPELPADRAVKLFRFANRVPLLYQQGSCALTEAVTSVDWKNYGLQQSGRNMPAGSAIILVHMASVWAPFTSESKEAIAHYPEIIKETKLALQEVGRQLQLFIGKKFKKQLAEKKADMFKLYSIELAEALSALTGAKQEEIEKKLVKLTDEMLKLGAIEEAGEKEAEEEKKPKRKLGAFKGEED